jgi:hypothetical protein
MKDLANINVSHIVYNLAFSPKIKHIDITNNQQANNPAAVEAFYKLLKISGSI